MVFLWFSYGFPMVFLFSTQKWDPPAISTAAQSVLEKHQKLLVRGSACRSMSQHVAAEKVWRVCWVHHLTWHNVAVLHIIISTILEPDFRVALHIRVTWVCLKMLGIFPMK